MLRSKAVFSLEKDLRIYEATAAALVLFGNVGLLVPFSGAVKGEFTAMVFAFLISLPVYFLCFRGVGFYKQRAENRAVRCLFGALITAFCLYVTLETSRHFIDYISTEVLIKNLKIYGAAAFLCVCLYALFKPPVATVKLSALCLAFAAVSVGALFAVSLRNFSFANLPQLLSGDALPIMTRSAKYLGMFFITPIVFAPFCVFNFEKPSLKTEISGFFVGAGLLCACFLSAALTFSLPVAAEMTHAYTMSVSVLSVGELFTRMDAFAYFMFFFSALVKVAVCGFAVKGTLAFMNVKRSGAIACLLITGAILVSYIL